MPLFQYLYQCEKTQEVTGELVNSWANSTVQQTPGLQHQWYLNINTAERAFEVGTLHQESEDISLWQYLLLQHESLFFIDYMWGTISSKSQTALIKCRNFELES